MTPTQLFSYEICDIFKNTFFYRTPSAAACESSKNHKLFDNFRGIEVDQFTWFYLILEVIASYNPWLIEKAESVVILDLFQITQNLTYNKVYVMLNFLRDSNI